MKREWHVRELLDMSKDQIWSLPDGGLFLTFDNGETHKVPTRSTIMSAYYWALVREWPGAQITMDHHIGFAQYKSDTHQKLASRVFWDVFFAHHQNYMVGEGQRNIWTMSRRIYEISNEIYNDSITMLGDYVTTMDIEDIVEILDHPIVTKAKSDFENGIIPIDEAHDKVFGLMSSDDPDLLNNEIRCGCAADNLNRRQITQVIGPRAFVPDINGESCKTPINVGYADGMDSLYDRFRESRTASISLYMASGPLEQSEYNNRMCQFLCGVVAGVWYGDCGGSHTVTWKVQPGDLKYLDGKYHMVDGKPSVIRPYMKDLEGQTIQLRTICTCSHGDPTHPCSVCVGLNSLTTPPGTNLGHHLSTEPLARISQTILSTKHVLASTKSVHLDINKTNAEFLRLNPENQHDVFFTKRISKGKFALRIAQADAMFINDVNEVESVADLTPSRVTALQNVQIIEYNRSGAIKEVFDLNVSIGGKGSPLTLDFLGYMKDVGWEIVGQALEVPLDEWDYGAPFIRTPRRGEDIMSILRTTSAFLHSPNEANAVRAVDFDSPGPAIRALLDVMTKKIHVNFSHVEVFVRALMAKGETSYALPVAGEQFRFLRLKEAIQKRGLGAAFAFEGQSDMIQSPATYMRDLDDIPGHPLDAFVQ